MHLDNHLASTYGPSTLVRIGLVWLLALGAIQTAQADPTVTQVVAGGMHSCALTTDGAVRCWGDNRFGQLGSTANSGTESPNPSPLAVQGLDNNVVAITAGGSHTCALTMAGAVRCWGLNNYGQLGSITNSGAYTPNPIPLNVQGLNDGIVAIAAGRHNTCALTSGGTVRCWGWNYYGQIGGTANNGTGEANPVPFDVQGLHSGAVAIAVGSGQTCALTTTAEVRCWGSNSSGELGTTVNSGTFNPNPSPLEVQGLDSGVTAIAAGDAHTCALTATGEVRCWGGNYSGQLGNLANYETNNPNATPLEVQGIGGEVVAITAGAKHTCAQSTVGPPVRCWGYNHYGQLGATTDGTTSPTPLNVQELDGDLSAIAANGLHTCALSTSGALRCWGYNLYGQLGSDANIATHESNPFPQDVQGLNTILPQGQEIAFAPPVAMPRGTSLALAATAISSETVSFDTWTPGICAIDGNTLTATTTGLCGVRASQAGSADYAPAPQQLRLIRVLRNLTVNVTGQGSVDIAPEPVGGSIDTCSEVGSPCIAAYDDATELSLAATPGTGWHLADWDGDCTVDGLDSLLATVVLDTNDVACTASFEIDTHAVTLAADPIAGGSVNTAGGFDLTAVPHGSVLDVVASPNPGWNVADPTMHPPLLSCGHQTNAIVLPDNSLAFDALIDETCTITARFANQAPNFTVADADLTALVNGAEVVVAAWATDIASGDSHDPMQAIHFELSSAGVTPPGTQLFAPGGEPFIDAAGTLRFTPGPDLGTSEFNVLLIDDASSDHGGNDTSIPQLLIISIAPFGTDLSIAADLPPRTRYPGERVTFALDLANSGPDDAADASIAWTPPAELSDIEWLCEPQGTATCAASGNGAIADGIDLPANEALRYLIKATLPSDVSIATIPGSASVAPGPDQVDLDHSDDSVSWQIRIDGLFRDSMEDAP